jgi:hypothetical protein
VSIPRDTPAQRRAKQTVRNLVLSLAVTLGLVALLVLGVPRDDSVRIQQVDYLSEAEAAAAAVGEPVVAPRLANNWWSNAARLESTAAVSSWYIGLVTPTSQFIGIRQAFVSNPSWLALQLQGNDLVGELEIDGVVWQSWATRTPSNPPRSNEFALVYEYGPGAIVLFGTATQAEFEEVARGLAESLAELKSAGSN